MKHAYICECNLKSCKEKIWLKPTEYAVMSKMGMVISKECAHREKRIILSRHKSYRVVPAQNGGKFLYTSNGGLTRT